MIWVAMGWPRSPCLYHSPLLGMAPPTLQVSWSHTSLSMLLCRCLILPGLHQALLGTTMLLCPSQGALGEFIGIEWEMSLAWYTLYLHVLSIKGPLHVRQGRRHVQCCVTEGNTSGHPWVGPPPLFNNDQWTCTTTVAAEPRPLLSCAILALPSIFQN